MPLDWKGFSALDPEPSASNGMVDWVELALTIIGFAALIVGGVWRLTHKLLSDLADFKVKCAETYATKMEIQQAEQAVHTRLDEHRRRIDGLRNGQGD